MRVATVSAWNDMIVPEIEDKLTTEWIERVAGNELFLRDKIIKSETTYFSGNEADANQSNTTLETKYKFKTYIPADRTRLITRVLTDKAGVGDDPSVYVALYVNGVLAGSQTQTVGGATVFSFEVSALPYADTLITGEIKANKNAATANYDIEYPYVYGEL